MKARLLLHNESIKLLKCNGEIMRISPTEARDFLLNFSDIKYYPNDGSWDYEDLTMENHRGATIAYVSDEGDLVVKDASLLKSIIIEGETDFLSVAEFAELHGKSSAMVRRLCQNNKIPGVILKASVYLIPSNAHYPKG